MATFYKTIICPRCKEDHLLITLNEDTKKLYLSCSECEASWPHPVAVNDPEKMFIDLSINASDPSLEDIENQGWEQYVSGTFESS